MPSADKFRVEMHAWDERIGPDASISHLTGGKKQFPNNNRSASSIPIPLHDAPFLVPMPVNGEHAPKPVIVNTDTHLWRSYRTVVSGEGQPEGKKMNARPLPLIEVQSHLRKSLREKLRDNERKELMMEEEFKKERERMLKRHAISAKKEEEWLRERATTMGFEGLKKPCTKAPPALVAQIPSEAVDRILASAPTGAGQAFSQGGKKIIKDHPGCRNNGRPFGFVAMDAGEKDTSMQRWRDKSMF